MAAENITVYIEPSQLHAQKNNNYSLFLAKKVNGVFTVIWQSKGPLPTVNKPSYEYKNVFSIQIPNFNVNYGNVTTHNGSVSFTSSGKNMSIELGQTVALDKFGSFGIPQNGGTPGEIAIINSLAANPNAVLSDDHGNPIFVNVESGMDIGEADLTPIDTYQIWFDNYQDTGTIIAHNISNVGTVVFDGGTDSKTISYNAKGAWEDGPLQSTVMIGDDLSPDGKLGEGVTVLVLATFKYALTLGAVTYLLNKLIGKFDSNLRPKEITASVGSFTMKTTFDNARAIVALLGLDAYEKAVDNALASAIKDPTSGLGKETWTLAEPQLSVAY